MKQSSAHEHGIIWRWLHRHVEPQPTPWQRFRAESEQYAQRPDTESIPPVHYPLHQRSGPLPPLPTERTVIPALEWCRARGLPPARTQGTGPIVKLPDFDKLPTLPPHHWRTVDFQAPAIDALATITPNPPTPVPAPPDWVSGPIDDAWLNSKPKGSAPLPPIIASIEVWGEPDVPQATGALDALAILAAQPPDEDTKEVPSVMRKKHTRESE